MGHPILKILLNIVNSNTIKNIPITRKYILAAEHRCGPNLGDLKGKTTRKKPLPVENTVTSMLCKIMRRYGNVTIVGDIFCVNIIPFLTTCTRSIKYGTAQHCPSTKTPDLFKILVQIQTVYKRGGFNIVEILMDGKFELLSSTIIRWDITKYCCSTRACYQSRMLYINAQRKNVISGNIDPI